MAAGEAEIAGMTEEDVLGLRPRPRGSAISSRYGSQALALGARDGGSASVDTAEAMAGFGPESVESQSARDVPVSTKSSTLAHVPSLETAASL